MARKLNSKDLKWINKERQDAEREGQEPKFCPLCGVPPEIGVTGYSMRHIFTFKCEKCGSSMIIHVSN